MAALHLVSLVPVWFSAATFALVIVGRLLSVGHRTLAFLRDLRNYREGR
jgi:hypothetical protein